MRTALYLWVRADTDPEPSLRRLRAAAQAEGVEVDEYIDIGGDGAASRPGFAALWAALASGEIDTIITASLDSLRLRPTGLLSFFTFIISKRIKLILVDAPHFVLTPSAQAILLDIAGARMALTAAGARERRQRAIEKVRATGGQVGRPRANVDVDRIIQMNAEGVTGGSIARALGVSASTVSRRLNEPRSL